eukprot:7067927-Ditylum_brightwellii.AAC.1
MLPSLVHWKDDNSIISSDGAKIWQSLGYILSGSDPSCMAARGSLLASRTSCEVTENALGKAIVLLISSNTNCGAFTVEKTEV